MSRIGAVDIAILWERVRPRSLRLRSVTCWCLGLAVSVLLPVGAAGQDLLVDEAISQWDYGGGFAAWSLDCDADGPGYLRRLSALAQRPQTLEETPRSCSREWHWGLTVDARGLYYYSTNRRQILRRPPDRGDLEEVVAQISTTAATPRTKGAAKRPAPSLYRCLNRL